MVREKMNQQRGRFFLQRRTRYAEKLYQDSGVMDVGTPDEEPFDRWTSSYDYARDFRTVKTARAMARQLMETRGIKTTIVNRDGEAIS